MDVLKNICFFGAVIEGGIVLIMPIIFMATVVEIWKKKKRGEKITKWDTVNVSLNEKQEKDNGGFILAIAALLLVTAGWFFMEGVTLEEELEAFKSYGAWEKAKIYWCIFGLCYEIYNWVMVVLWNFRDKSACVDS